MACINGSAQDNLHFEISIGRAPAPPVTFGFVAAPQSERGEKTVERLQRCRPVGEITVDLALVQKPALAPDQAPLHAIGHGSPPPTRVRPPCFFVRASKASAPPDGRPCNRTDTA